MLRALGLQVLGLNVDIVTVLKVQEVQSSSCEIISLSLPLKELLRTKINFDLFVLPIFLMEINTVLKKRLYFFTITAKILACLLK